MNTPNSTPISHPALRQLLLYENIHHKDFPDKSVKTQIIENLEKEIKDELLDKIKRITGRLVLLVGDNIDLLEALGSYYYCIRGETSLPYYSLYGEDVTELNNIFSRVESFYDGNDKITEGKLLDRLFRGSSVFLNGLKCRESDFLEKLTARIRDFKSSENNKGVLIVSTLTPPADIPKVFMNVFESNVISLESAQKMQGKANGLGVPHTVNTFPMPPGANINDIKMCLLDDENIRIDVKEESKTFHYAQMGLSAKTNNRPLAAWDALQDYAEYNGNLHKVDNARQKRSERLNKLLKSFFQTDKDLIVSNQTLFKISKRKASSKKPVHIQLTECPVCKKNHRHYCYVCEDTTNHCQECHDGIYTEAHNKLN
ncbi:MAG: hypothetical protein L3J17_02110 [Candidatus Jettenia sp.]|nr:MAG: hypothetical protein L3J17_02110 [Candidatus Jettenia sp.]